MPKLNTETIKQCENCHGYFECKQAQANLELCPGYAYLKSVLKKYSPIYGRPAHGGKIKCQ